MSSREGKTPSDRPIQHPPLSTTAHDRGFISNIASSASGLFNSVTRVAPSTANPILGSATSSSSKSGQQHAPSSASSPLWAETTTSYRSLQSPHPSSEPRSQPFDQLLAEAAQDDFAYFASNPTSALDSHPLVHAPPPQAISDYSDGNDVVILLSGPLVTSEIYPDDISQSWNISHPAVVGFAQCEDPVEFLQANPDWSKYTDSVWGGLLEIMQNAQKEVEKGKGTENNGKSVKRLKLVWGHMRAKL